MIRKTRRVNTEYWSNMIYLLHSTGSYILIHDRIRIHALDVINRLLSISILLYSMLMIECHRYIFFSWCSFENFIVLDHLFSYHIGVWLNRWISCYDKYKWESFICERDDYLPKSMMIALQMIQQKKQRIREKPTNHWMVWEDFKLKQLVVVSCC